MFNVGDSHVELVHAAIGTRHAVEHFQTHRTIRWVFRLRAKIPPSHPKKSGDTESILFLYYIWSH
jgi:hypothetical protein